MKKTAGLILCCILYAIKTEATNTDTVCDKLKVDGALFHKAKIDGEYELTYKCTDGSPVYQKFCSDSSNEDYDDDVYLYFYKNSTFSGWLIGEEPCNSKLTFAKISTEDTDPDNADDRWQERRQDKFIPSPEMEVQCEDDDGIGEGTILLISIGCTLFVLLVALAPVIWMYVANKKRRPPMQAAVSPSMNTQSQEPAHVPIPPPYSAEAPPVYTVHQYGKAEAKSLPSYVGDMTHIIEKRKDIQLPPPPSYDNPSYEEPPSYSAASLAMVESPDYDNAVNEEGLELRNFNNSANNTAADNINSGNRTKNASNPSAPTCSPW